MMNERIKELLLKAGWSGFEALDERNQKFAELIVRQCMTLMNNERDYYSKPGSYEPESYYIRCAAKVDAFDDAVSLIKNHFGIEE